MECLLPDGRVCICNVPHGHDTQPQTFLATACVRMLYLWSGIHWIWKLGIRRCRLGLHALSSHLRVTSYTSPLIATPCLMRRVDSICKAMLSSPLLMEDLNPVENIDKLGDLMFQTWDKSQLLRRVLWINAQLTNVWHLKHKISQPIYIFNRENSHNSEWSNGPRRGLDFIALIKTATKMF